MPPTCGVQAPALGLYTATSRERFTPRKDVHITNQCNDLLLEVRKPVSLMVPAAVDLAQPASPPDPNSHDADHFLCYAAKAQKKALDGSKLPKFAKGLQVEVVDAFQSRRYDLKRVTKYCQPVYKSGSPSLLSGPDKGAPKPIAPVLQKHSEARLVCYQAKTSRKLIAQTGCGPAQPGDRGTPISPKQAKHEKRSGVRVADQLGSGLRGTVKEVELCIPPGAGLAGSARRAPAHPLGRRDRRAQSRSHTPSP